MAYNEKLAARIRQSLTGTKNLEEKQMFGGIAFMVNDKMCVGVNKDDLMIRCEPEMTDELLKKKGTHVFDLSGGRPMKGWLLVSAEGTTSKKDFDYWIDVAVEANKKLAAVKKKK